MLLFRSKKMSAWSNSISKLTQHDPPMPRQARVRLVGTVRLAERCNLARGRPMAGVRQVRGPQMWSTTAEIDPLWRLKR